MPVQGQKVEGLFLRTQLATGKVKINGKVLTTVKNNPKEEGKTK
jgi:hypothetical protein